MGVEIIRQAKQEAEYAGKPFDIREAIREDGVNLLYTYIEAYMDEPGNLIEDFPGVTILGILQLDEQTFIKPSDAFRERVLKGLGALKPDQKLSDLKRLPPGEKGFRGAVYRSYRHGGYAESIPCQIQGVYLRVNFRQPGVHVSIDSPTLEKIIDFPSS